MTDLLSLGHVAIQAPVSDGQAKQLGPNAFRKQILKKGKLPYKGSELDFNDAYLDTVIAAYQDNAFDEVPLVFAPKDNAHSQAVDHVRGIVVGMERVADGVDAIIQFDDPKDAERVVKHPNLGVSPRIEHMIDRGGGRTFAAGVHHVLATTNPRVTGMRGWEPVDLANDEMEVIDLSTPEDAAGDGSVATADSGDKKKGNEMGDKTPVSPFTDEEWAALRDLLAKSAAGGEGKPDAPDTPDAPDMTDEELDALAAQILAEEQELVEASDVDTAAIELAVKNHPLVVELAAEKAAMASRLSAIEAERDAAKFASLKQTLFTELGVPPFIVDLAAPLLTGSHVVELAHGNKVDAGEVVLKVIKGMAEHNSLGLSQTVYPSAQPPAEDDKQFADDVNGYAAKFGLLK